MDRKDRGLVQGKRGGGGKTGHTPCVSTLLMTSRLHENVSC